VLCSCLGLEAYPQAELAGIWKTLLLNQFHDILPGSSIHEVYEVAQAELEGGLAECRSLQERAIAAVGTAREGKTCVFNPSNHVFEGTVELGAAWSATLAGSFEVQAEPEGAVAWLRVPPLTALELEQQAGASVSACFVALSEGTPPVLENEQVRYEFDANLRLVRAFDKLQARELIAALRPANVLTLYDDRPHAWDAWEVDSFYEQAKLGDAEAIGGIEALSGPVRSGLRATLRVGNSSVSQVVWLGKAGARLDFVTQVSWQERHKMLRVAFPTTLSASEASFEIQYGVVRRATHQNTGWERARFESLGHRFADLSEPDYGVALLNDCKYGYKVTRDTLDLNLLRSPTDPDPIADVGQHRFTYSLYPHARDLPHSDVAVQAAMLNQGVLVLPNSELTLPLEAPLELRGDGLTLGALKRAENERCFVVRIVETRGVRTRGRLSTRQETWEIVPTDLMEWEDEVDRRQQGSVELELAPFEIQTYRIWPR
jgi:alpha-mannosidase